MTSQITALSWHDRASVIEPRTQAFIGGRYVDAASGATFTRVNPANGQVLAQVAACDARDIDLAVAAARGVVCGQRSGPCHGRNGAQVGGLLRRYQSKYANGKRGDGWPTPRSRFNLRPSH